MDVNHKPYTNGSICLTQPRQVILFL